MQTKLTLRMDDELIMKAKKYAAKRGRSISGIVADYFATIDGEDDTDITPRVRSLIGAIPGDALESDYRRHLEGKHK